MGQLLRGKGVGTLAVIGVALLLYVSTAAPSITWGGGDSPKFSIWVHETTLGWAPDFHPLYILLAKAFSSLPWPGSLAYRLNLFSGLSGALTIGLLYLFVRAITGNRGAAWVAVLALTFSHVFWLHSVITEVYTLHALFLVGVLSSGFMWMRTGGMRWGTLAWFLFGLAVSHHILILLTFPVLSLMTYFQWQDRNVRVGQIASLIMCALLGCSLLLFIFVKETQLWQDPLTKIGQLKLLFGLGAAQTYAAWSWKKFLSYFLLLLYQFPILAFVLGGIGIFWSFALDQRLGSLLTIAFLLYALCPMVYHVADYYQFALSSFVIFSMWVGCGTDWFFQRVRLGSKARIALFVSLCLFPYATYLGTASLLEKKGFSFVAIRSLPYRKNSWYFFYPPKNGDRGAERFASEAFKKAAPDAVITGDFTPLMVLEYFQKVEGMRPDITLFLSEYKVDEQLEAIERFVDKKPVYVSALEEVPGRLSKEFYLHRETLERRFEITEEYPLFRVRRRSQDG